MTKHSAKEVYLQIVPVLVLIQVEKWKKPHTLLDTESHNTLASIDLAARFQLYANKIKIKMSRINEKVGHMVIQEVDMKIWR